MLAFIAHISVTNGFIIITVLSKYNIAYGVISRVLSYLRSLPLLHNFPVSGQNYIWCD